MSDDWDDVHWQDATPVEETMINSILAQRKRIEELEGQLKTVLDRETSILRYYDAKLDAADAKLAEAEWMLVDAMVQLRDGKAKTRRNRADLIDAFLTKIKGDQP